jgi:hypothetical protein
VVSRSPAFTSSAISVYAPLWSRFNEAAGVLAPTVYPILTKQRKKLTILSGGSLGSLVDENRSYLRYSMRIADTLSIGILNAHCGVKVTFDATPDRGSVINLKLQMLVVALLVDC